MITFAKRGDLHARRQVLRSEANENNEIGLPLTVLRLEPGHEVAVLEMGMYVPGEIAQLCRIARPAIGVVTAVRPIHLSRAGSLEAIEAGKAELVEALPLDGVAVLNADDERVRRMGGRTRSRTAAVALEAGLTLDETVEGLARPWSLPHRSTLVHAGGITILDDCYNAGPDSMRAALELLAELPGRRRVAVLGEMAELGSLAAEAHAAVGRWAADVVELLVTVGAGAEPLAAGALAAGFDPARLVRVADAASALAALRPCLADGDVVLVKASRAAALERVVGGLVEAFGR